MAMPAVPPKTSDRPASVVSLGSAVLVPVSLLAMWNGHKAKLPDGPAHGLLERVVRRLVTVAHSWVVPVMVVGSLVEPPMQRRKVDLEDKDGVEQVDEFREVA